MSAAHSANPLADDLQDLCIHDLLKAQAQRTPDATALVLHTSGTTHGPRLCR